METTISRLDSKTGQVRVTFEHAGVTHTRQVNACIREDGTHDIEATRARVAEVALGVEQKIALGVIRNAPVEEPVEETGEAPAEPASEA